MKCDTCQLAITVACDHQQGRCPHRKPMIDIEFIDISHCCASIATRPVRIAAVAALIYGLVVVGGVLLKIIQGLT